MKLKWFQFVQKPQRHGHRPFAHVNFRERCPATLNRLPLSCDILSFLFCELPTLLPFLDLCNSRILVATFVEILSIYPSVLLFRRTLGSLLVRNRTSANVCHEAFVALHAVIASNQYAANVCSKSSDEVRATAAGTLGMVETGGEESLCIVFGHTF